jgi:TonB-linked SusC/RagA family outer membrane protein
MKRRRLPKELWWPISRRFLVMVPLLACLSHAEAFAGPLVAQIELKPTAQQNVKGTVRDEEGMPLPGVSILEKGTKNGASTNGQGEFSIVLKNPNAILIVSSIGFLPQEVPVKGGTVNIVLKADKKALDEVVVVGYGTQKKSDVTGSISSVPKERLDNLPVTNVLQAMQGSVAGVNISSSSNAPGKSPDFFIRGLHSITASNSPLIVLDGIPFSGSYNDINSTDIQSIDVLKDASATAIYGTRGSNGVVLITTKRGKTGKPVVAYSTWFGLENITGAAKPMSGAQYAQKNLDYTAQTNKASAPVPNQYEKDNYDKGIETDWLKEISQQGFIQNHELNVSGGTEDVKYYVSGNYTKEKGVLKGYQYSRFSVRSNLDAKITSWLTAGTNLFFTNNDQGGGKVNLYMATVMSPYGHLYNAQGDYEIYPMNPEQLYTNPLLGLYQPTLNLTRTLSGNAYAEIKPEFIKGFKYRLNTAYTYKPDRTGDYTGRKTGDLLGTASLANEEAKNWLIENIFGYQRTFGKHNIDITGLYSAQKNDDFKSTINANTFINDMLDFNNIGAGQKQTTTSNYYASTLVSQMLRINYAYDSRYLLTLTARRDGYSGFGSDNKYGTFPSIALGWNINNESFLKESKIVNSLKLRLSYGVSGNQGVSPYNTLSTLATVPYIYDGVTTIGVTPSRIGNKNLKWESTKGFNAAIDFSILSNRISGSLETYFTNTYDLLLSRKIPNITGYTSILDNVGKTANKGFEASITSRNIEREDFSWETNFNFSLNRNKVKSLYGDGKDDIVNNLFIGKSLQGVYDYKLIGVWQKGDDFSVDPSAKPGDLKFQDLNSDGKINSQDRTYLGTRLPNYIAGITNTFKYKHFSLSVFIQTVQGVLKPNTIYDYRDQLGRINLPASYTYWTPDNKSNTSPSLAYTNSRQYTYPVDGSFTRIKDATLSYDFAVEKLNKFKINNLRIYVSGRNLATFSKWLGWDPESDPYKYYDNQASTFYPQVRTFVMGINIGLQ